MVLKQPLPGLCALNPEIYALIIWFKSYAYLVNNDQSLIWCYGKMIYPYVKVLKLSHYCLHNSVKLLHYSGIIVGIGVKKKVLQYSRT